MEISAQSPYARQPLKRIPIREQTNILVVALHEPTGGFVYNPSPDQPLDPGAQLILIGEADEVDHLRKLVAES